jgi:hypothetical protein
VGALFIPVSDRGAFRRPGRLRGVELAVALFDAASPLVPGNDNTDMVRPSPPGSAATPAHARYDRKTSW